MKHLIFAAAVIGILVVLWHLRPEKVFEYPRIEDDEIT